MCTLVPSPFLNFGTGNTYANCCTLLPRHYYHVLTFIALSLLVTISL